MSQDLHEPKTHISDASKSGDMQMLSNVCNEINYRFDMCRITTWLSLRSDKQQSKL
jgi:hypothetical protein